MEHNEQREQAKEERRPVRTSTVLVVGVLLALAAFVAWPGTPPVVYAHCDTLDGPVVAEARAALEKSDVTPVLKWVREQDEDEIRAAFARTLTVRAGGGEARALADMYFFETLVRVHRASEGAPFNGLKPAGQVEPPVAAADAAIEGGNVDELVRRIGQAAANGVKGRFTHLMEARRHKDESIEAGRKYVEAYVAFTHYVEGLHNTITAGSGHGH